MARDLIPPSSPAGRPLPDGTPRLIELPPEPPRSPAEPAQRPAPGPSAFRNRFGFLMGSLAGVFVAAALVVIAVVGFGSSDNGVSEGLADNWSRWHPSDTSIQGGAGEIAAKVGMEYKYGNGQQLTKVTGSPLGINVKLVTSGPIRTFEGNQGVLFTLDGLGPNGSMRAGTASTQRLQLIRREALELALY